MKCIKCNKDAKKIDRERSGRCCPSCHHPFVADPQIDGVSDMAIKNAEDTVSANGTFFFTKQQLKYQLQRKLKKKDRGITIGATIAALIFLITLILASFKTNFFIFLVMFSFACSTVLWMGKAHNNKALKNLDALLTRWIVINPHDKMLTEQKYQANLGAVVSNNLDDVSFDRVLICDRNDTVDFFLSNLFHFHYSCPVLGGNNYPANICDDMIARLKQNPQLKVFLLHDYSPAGLAFVRKMKSDSQWFGGQHVDIVDLGLNVNQKKMFKNLTSKRVDRNQKVQETADISVFQPAALVAMTGAAINEGVPFDLIKSIATASSSNDGYG